MNSSKTTSRSASPKSSQTIPIFILHGWAVDPDNKTKWHPLLSELKKKGLDATFLPLPGLTTPLDKVWQLSDYVAWLESKLQKHKSVVLIGHSFGGQLAIRYAATHRQQVAKLILIDSSGLRDHSFLMSAKRAVFKALATIGKQLTKAAFARALLYKLAREKDYYQASETLRQTMHNVITDEVHDDLPQIEQDTLIIWGKEDTVTPIQLGQTLAAGIKQSRMVVIDQARHSPQFTHVREVADSMYQFLESAKV